MSSEKLNIVFMGTPDFASTCLEVIISSKHKLLQALLLPQTDNLEEAERFMNQRKGLLNTDLPLVQPEKLKAEEFHEVLKVGSRLVCCGGI